MQYASDVNGCLSSLPNAGEVPDVGVLLQTCLTTDTLTVAFGKTSAALLLPPLAITLSLADFLR